MKRAVMDPRDALKGLELIGGSAEAGDDDTVSNKVWYLRRSPIFATLDDRAVDGAQGIFTMKTYPRKTLVFDLGDSERSVYILKRGKVRLARLNPEGKELTVVVLGPGDLFGEEVLFGQQRRSTVAVVVEEALLCTARAADLFRLLAEDPSIALNVAEMLSGRLDRAAATMEDLAYAKLPDRLLHLFERLAGEHGKPAPGGIAIDMPLTHTEIASLVGSTRESVSLEMNALLRAGRLRLEGRRYILPT